MKYNIFIIFCLLLFACDSTNETTTTLTGNLDSPGGIQLFEFSPKEGDIDTIEVKFEKSEMTGEETFYLVPFLLKSDDEINTSTRMLSVDYSGSVNGEPLTSTKTQKEFDGNTVVNRLNKSVEQNIELSNNTALFFNSLKEIKTNKNFKNKSFKYAETKENYSFGKEEIFKFSWDGLTKESDITGQVRAFGKESVFFLDKDDIPDESNAQTELDDKLSELSEKIETIVIPRIRTILGEETAEGSIFSNLTLDSIDNKVAFLFSGRLNGVGNIGFLNGKDLYKRDNLLNPFSNQQKILYLPIPGKAISDEEILSQVVYNLQKMFSLIENTIWPYETGGNLEAEVESSWLNDGLSCLVSDLVGYGNYCFIAAYTYSTSLNSISLTGGIPSLGQRGGVYLLLRYLFEREGGATYSTLNEADIEGAGLTFIKALYGSGFVGIQNIVNALHNENFKTVISWFISTLLLDGTGLNNDFKFEDEAIDSFTNIYRGVQLRKATDKTRTINGTAYTIDGVALNQSMPQATPLSISPATINIYTLVPTAGTFDYTFSSESNSNLYLAVIRQK